MKNRLGISAWLMSALAFILAARGGEADPSKRSVSEYAQQVLEAFSRIAEGDAGAAKAALAETNAGLRGWEYDYISAAIKDKENSGTFSTFPRRTRHGIEGGFGVFCGLLASSNIVLPTEGGTSLLDLAAPKQSQLKMAASAVTDLPASFAACAEKGKRIAVTTEEGVVSIYDPELHEVGRLQVSAKMVKSLAISPSGEQIATETHGDGVVLWDATTGQKIANIGQSYTFSRPIVFTPDGQQVALGGGLEMIELFDAKTGKKLREIGPSRSYIMSIAFSADGKWMATGARGDMSKSISIFEFDTGKPIALIDDHGAYINSLAFSPDGKRLLSGSCDGTLRLWHVPSGMELLRLNVGSMCGDTQFIDGGKTIVWGSRFGVESVSLR